MLGTTLGQNKASLTGTAGIPSAYVKCNSSPPGAAVSSTGTFRNDNGVQSPKSKWHLMCKMYMFLTWVYWSLGFLTIEMVLMILSSRPMLTRGLWCAKVLTPSISFHKVGSHLTELIIVMLFSKNTQESISFVAFASFLPHLPASRILWHAPSLGLSGLDMHAIVECKGIKQLGGLKWLRLLLQLQKQYKFTCQFIRTLTFSNIFDQPANPLAIWCWGVLAPVSRIGWAWSRVQRRVW